METPILPTADPQALPRALEALATGALIAFPTDTGYNLGADPWLPGAVARLAATRGPDVAEPLSLLVAGLEHLWRVVPGLSPVAQALTSAFWPGPLTLVVPGRPDLPTGITGGHLALALRQPDQPWTRKLLQAAGGALAVLPAAPVGDAAPLTVAALSPALAGHTALILDGGPCPAAVATVLDLSGPTPRVLHEGAIPAALLLAALDAIREA